MEATIKNIARNILGMAMGEEMAQAVATYHLANLMGMLNEKQRIAVKASLPIIVEAAAKRTIEYFKDDAGMLVEATNQVLATA